MAGKRQHHVWKMLQNGFSWEDHGESQVWVYRKGVAPRQTVTRKFGRDVYFYGSADSDTDENITRYENSAQGFIQEIRKLQNGEAVDTEAAAALVSHLELRSLFLRSEMSRLGERLMRFLRDCFSSPKKYQQVILSYLKNHPDILDEEMARCGIPGNMRPALRDMMMLAAPELVRESAPNMAVVAEELYGLIGTAMGDTAKNAHNAALLTNFSEAKRTESHRSLQFSVLRPMDAGFILPDTSLAFFMQKGCAPFSQKRDKVEAVFVPLSSEVAVVGRRNPLFDRDMKTIQRALASCAYEAFLSPCRSDAFQALSRRVSDLLCMGDLVHASSKGSMNDDFQRDS